MQLSQETVVVGGITWYNTHVHVQARQNMPRWCMRCGGVAGSCPRHAPCLLGVAHAVCSIFFIFFSGPSVAPCRLVSIPPHPHPSADC